ncbi:hypothetical protein D2V05_19235 [Flagellimonas pelagia]|uniref:Uncharacterized protein n=1 Tax=Flagellimonas pelagia TaxID=2306998 RepID=A0A3A1NGY0_9FLAO|nr:hypothetical protein D2V05_19235 [Allomuricauda maritima]
MNEVLRCAMGVFEVEPPWLQRFTDQIYVSHKFDLLYLERSYGNGSFCFSFLLNPIDLIHGNCSHLLRKRESSLL